MCSPLNRLPWGVCAGGLGKGEVYSHSEAELSGSFRRSLLTVSVL